MNKYQTCLTEQKLFLNYMESQKMDFHDSKSYLDRDVIAKRSIGSIFHPSITIGNTTFRGDYQDPNNLFKAICSTILKRPEKCKNLNLVDK